jgi:hypothetical protein
MKLHTKQEYKKAKARLAQLSRHGDYADAAEFEGLADAVEEFEERQSTQTIEEYEQNMGA